MNDTNGQEKQVTAEQEHMLRTVAEVAAKTLTPIETHSICVLLAMAFGRGTIQSRIFARHVNATRLELGLARITQAAAGNPTLEEKMNILRSAVEKLGDEAQNTLFQVLLRSPLYALSQPDGSDHEDSKD
jgi:hypothetical protein